MQHVLVAAFRHSLGRSGQFYGLATSSLGVVVGAAAVLICKSIILHADLSRTCSMADWLVCVGKLGKNVGHFWRQL